MRRKIVGILVCTLVIAVILVPMAGSIAVGPKHGSNYPDFGPLNTGDRSAYSKRGDNLDNWGITESIDLSNSDLAQFTYFQYYNIVPINGPDVGYVKISDNGGSSWTILDEVQGKTIEWEENTFDISDWVGGSILIGFEYKTEDDSISMGWYVDRITVVDADGMLYEENFESFEHGDNWGDWIIWELNSLNDPPTDPIINGQKSGNTNVEYTYSFHSFDPNFDDVSYYIDWGDGTFTDWTDFQPSGPGAYSENHAWTEEGTYTIKAKAKDIYEAESAWAEYTVTMKRSRQLIKPLFLQFLENHPNIFPILRLLLGL